MSEQQKLTQNDAAVGDRFGTGAALSGDGTLAIGAPEKNMPGGQNVADAVYVFNIGKTSPFDFDGDSKTDISIFRPSAGQWWYYRSSDSGNCAATFGTSSDKLVPGDFTSDGKTDIVIFRPDSGEWFINKSTGGTTIGTFGTDGDVPAVADFDGDNKADIAIFRPSTGEWFILRSKDFSNYSFPFGTNGDVPAPGDYDGDGRFDATVFRPSQSTWYVQRTTAGILIQGFRITGDKPVPAAFIP